MDSADATVGSIQRVIKERRGVLRAELTYRVVGAPLSRKGDEWNQLGKGEVISHEGNFETVIDMVDPKKDAYPSSRC